MTNNMYSIGDFYHIFAGTKNLSPYNHDCWCEIHFLEPWKKFAFLMWYCRTTVRQCDDTVDGQRYSIGNCTAWSFHLTIMLLSNNTFSLGHLLFYFFTIVRPCDGNSYNIFIFQPIETVFAIWLWLVESWAIGWNFVTWSYNRNKADVLGLSYY